MIANINLNEVNMNISGLEAKQKELLTKRKDVLKTLDELDKQAYQLG
jgi:hypothetical protein